MNKLSQSPTDMRGLIRTPRSELFSLYEAENDAEGASASYEAGSQLPSSFWSRSHIWV